MGAGGDNRRQSRVVKTKVISRVVAAFIMRSRHVSPAHTLAEPWADTGTSTGRLMIAVLGGLADVERDLIRTRTAEGRSRAQKRGQHMGRPPKLTAAQQAEARRRRAEGATLGELARSYGVGKSTISRLTARQTPL